MEIIKSFFRCFECEACEFRGLSKPSLLTHMAKMHSSEVKGNITRSDKKTKLPEKKEKWDICGQMLLNLN